MVISWKICLLMILDYLSDFGLENSRQKIWFLLLDCTIVAIEIYEVVVTLSSPK